MKWNARGLQLMGEHVLIKDMRPGMRNITCTFIVLEKASDTDVYYAKDGSRIRSCKVADKSGSINFSAWDDIGELIEPGEIFKLVKGYVSLWKGCMNLYLGKHGVLHRTGEICMLFSEEPNMSDAKAEFLKDYLHQDRRTAAVAAGGRPSSRPGSPKQVALDPTPAAQPSTLVGGTQHQGVNPHRGLDPRHGLLRNHLGGSPRGRQQQRHHPYPAQQRRGHHRQANHT